MIISAKEELKHGYNIELKTEDKLNALVVTSMDLEKELDTTTYRKARIPLLAQRAAIDECIEIMKAYHAVEKANANEQKT